MNIIKMKKKKWKHYKLKENISEMLKDIKHQNRIYEKMLKGIKWFV